MCILLDLQEPEKERAKKEKYSLDEMESSSPDHSKENSTDLYLHGNINRSPKKKPWIFTFL